MDHLRVIILGLIFFGTSSGRGYEFLIFLVAVNHLLAGLNIDHLGLAALGCAECLNFGHSLTISIGHLGLLLYNI